MNVADRERAITRVCFDAAPKDADLDALGERDRWVLYRQMVRSRIADMVRAGLPRTATALGDRAFEALVSAWMAEAAPRTPYLRDVALEFHAFADAGWRKAAPTSAWIADLARYEATRWELAHGETDEAPATTDFTFEDVPVISPAVRILDLAHPVQKNGGTPERFMPEATSLVVYRRADDHKVGFFALTPFRATLLRSWQHTAIPATETARKAAAAHGKPIDEAFVTDLGEFCAELLSRTVLLGSRA